MFCEYCEMIIHDSEITWCVINNKETPFCPVHRTMLIDLEIAKLIF